MASANLKISQALVASLLRAGVEKVVVCPGSRNAPLIFALQACPQLQIFHHLDERSAAFFALGLTALSLKPVAVVCTSGTAVAEVLPATLEAYYQNLPLILISADRPASYRGSGAPQSIDQVGIFSHYAPCLDIQSEDDFAKISNFKEFPLHLNICLEEPAAGDWSADLANVDITPTSFTKKISVQAFDAVASFCAEPDLLVTLGSLTREEASFVAPFLAKLGAPVLADTSANISCDGPHMKFVLQCGEKLLREWKPARVLRLGSVPSFRFWRDLETNSIGVLNVAVNNFSTRTFSGLAKASANFAVETFSGLAEAATESHDYAKIFAQDKKLKLQLEEILQAYPYSELAFIRKLEAAPGMLYLGNSMPIREWNLVNGAHDCCYANRGVNGIDGQLSTFLGIADSFRESWALVGDQTALYDLNALAMSNQQCRKKNFTSKRRIVVMNNGGGKIFSHLGYSKVLDLQQRKVLESQHRWEFRGWAEMFGWAYERWEKDVCLIDPQLSDLVIEIAPDATQTHHFWNQWRQV